MPCNPLSSASVDRLERARPSESPHVPPIFHSPPPPISDPPISDPQGYAIPLDEHLATKLSDMSVAQELLSKTRAMLSKVQKQLMMEENGKKEMEGNGKKEMELGMDSSSGRLFNQEERMGSRFTPNEAGIPELRPRLVESEEADPFGLEELLKHVNNYERDYQFAAFYRKTYLSSRYPE